MIQEAEVGGMWPQARGMLEVTRRWERRGADSPTASGGTAATVTVPFGSFLADVGTPGLHLLPTSCLSLHLPADSKSQSAFPETQVSSPVRLCH